MALVPLPQLQWPCEPNLESIVQCCCFAPIFAIALREKWIWHEAAFTRNTKLDLVW